MAAVAVEYQNGTIIVLCNFHVLLMPHIKFQLNLKIQEKMVFEQFQECHHGGHPGYWNGTILAILNLHVNSKLPTKFGLHPTLRAGADVV